MFAALGPDNNAVNYSNVIALAYVNAPANQTPNLNITGIVSVSANTYVHLNVYATKAITINGASRRFQAVRLGNA